MSHFVFALCYHPLMANSLFIKATHRFTKKGKHHISFCPPYIKKWSHSKRLAPFFIAYVKRAYYPT